MRKGASGISGEQQFGLAELNQATLSATLVTVYSKECVRFLGKIPETREKAESRWVGGDNGKQLGQDA